MAAKWAQTIRLTVFKAHLNRWMRYLGLAMMFVIWYVESPRWVSLAQAMIAALCILKIVHLVAYLVLGCGSMLWGNFAGSILVYLATGGIVSITWTLWREFQAEQKILLFDTCQFRWATMSWTTWSWRMCEDEQHV